MFRRSFRFRVECNQVLENAQFSEANQNKLVLLANDWPCKEGPNMPRISFWLYLFQTVLWWPKSTCNSIQHTFSLDNDNPVLCRTLSIVTASSWWKYSNKTCVRRPVWFVGGATVCLRHVHSRRSSSVGATRVSIMLWLTGLKFESNESNSYYHLLPY